MVPPLSAFAARKAVVGVPVPPAVASDSTPINDIDAKDPQASRHHGRSQTNERPKKRKRALESRTSFKTHVESQRKENTTRPSRRADVTVEVTSGDRQSPETTSYTRSNSDSEQVGQVLLIPYRSLKADFIKSFFPSQRNFVAATGKDWTIRLAGEDTLVLVGHYDLWVRKGVVSLYGATLPASSKLHRVYAPSTHALPVIRPVNNPYGRYGEPAEIKIIRTKAGVRLLKDLSPIFGRLWNQAVSGDDLQDKSLRRSFALMQTSTDDPLRRPLISLTSSIAWQVCTQEILAQKSSKDPRAVLVCGAKGSGKSTYCRSLTNAIISRPPSTSNSTLSNPLSEKVVALLDIDPGQPEFSLPGQLSLSLLRSFNFGPPFTHPVILEKSGDKLVKLQCHGSLSPKDDPNHYLDCVLDLYEAYRSLLHTYHDLTLVVNTSGWIQGGGLDLIIRLTQALHVSDVVHLNNSNSGIEDVSSVLADVCSQNTAKFHKITDTTSNIATRTAAELRTMQTLSYFHLEEPELGNLRWNSRPLHETPPMVFHYAGPKQAILAVMLLGDVQDPNLCESILTGSLVDILLIDSPTAVPSLANENEAHENDASLPSHPSVQLTPDSEIPYIAAQSTNTRSVRPLDPKHTRCLAQALIHSIDTRNKQIHLLVPPHLISPKLAQLNSDSLKERIVLVRGRGQAPTWVFEESLHQDKARQERWEREWRAKDDELEDAAKEVGDFDVQESQALDLAEMMRGVPWASVVRDGNSRSKGGRKRKGGRRRDGGGLV